jgi:two-component system sensor histidine kinase/response regulator
VSPQRLYEALLRWLPTADFVAPAVALVAAGGDGVDPLSRIEGFDPQVGLALVSGESDAFADLLRRFIVHHEDGLPGLDNCLATGQREQARRLVHSLKGGAAAIGAFALEKKAASLEAALSPACETRGLRLAALDLEYELVQLVAALHDCVPLQAVLEPGAGEARLSRLQLEEALDTLSWLLDCGDAGAERLFRDLAPDMRAVFGGACEELGRAVRNHDDERALALLEALRAGARLQPDAGETT